MAYQAIAAGHVAVITGGASTIGLAAAEWFPTRRLRVAIADLGATRLEAAKTRLIAVGAAEMMALQVDAADAAAFAGLVSSGYVRFRRGLVERR